MECRDAPAERPRPAPGQALSRSLVALDQNSTIIAVIEMSQSSWLVAGMLPGIERQPRRASSCVQRPERAYWNEHITQHHSALALHDCRTDDPRWRDAVFEPGT